MRKVKFMIVIVVLFHTIGCGQNASFVEELKEASKIVNDGERLQKYDQILVKNGIKEQDSVEVAKLDEKTDSKWLVVTDVNPIDDSKIILFSLMADEGKTKFGDPVTLIIRYKSRKTEVYVNWSDYLGSDVRVTMRIGADKAETFLWNMSTDSKASFYPRNSVTLINRIKDVEKVVFQCTPYNENPITAVFDVRGLSEVAEEYMADLKWW